MLIERNDSLIAFEQLPEYKNGDASHVQCISLQLCGDFGGKFRLACRVRGPQIANRCELWAGPGSKRVISWVASMNE